MTSASPHARREIVRFLKFAVVGAIGFVVDFGTFNALTIWLGMISIAAQVVSFATAVTSNFLWNRYWTYPDSRSKPLIRQAGQFALINLIGLGIRTPMFTLLEQPLIRQAVKLLAIWPTNLPPGAQSFLPVQAEVLGRNFSLASAVIVVLFWNFFINRIWTYSDVS